MKNFLLNLLFLCIFYHHSSAQKISYATQGDINLTKHGFNIIGKIKEKYFVHISQYNPLAFSNDYLPTIRSSTINVYDKEMQLISQQQLPLPKKYFGVYFIPYEDFIYMFYQYTEANHLFCMTVKIDSNGKMIDKPLICAETTEKNYFSYYPAYNIIWSENKKQIAIFTMQENEQDHKLSLIIYNEKLKAVKTEMYEINRASVHESFSDFNIDNEGNFIFLKSDLFDPADPNKYVLYVAKYNSSSISLFDITPHSIQLNYPVLKIDNLRNQINFLSFYVDSSINVLLKDVPLSKAADKSGFFQVTWNVEAHQLVNAFAIPFANMIKGKQLDEDLAQLPIQNFVVGKIYFKADKKFLLTGSSFNARNNLYERNLKIWQNMAESQVEYLNYTNDNINIQNDILLLSFDSTGNCEKFSFVNELESVGSMSINTRNAIHYLFVHKEKSDYSFNHITYSSEGEIQQQAPITGIKNHQFGHSIRYLQVSDNELICAVIYNNRLNFAKMEF